MGNFINLLLVMDRCIWKLTLRQGCHVSSTWALLTISLIIWNKCSLSTPICSYPRTLCRTRHVDKDRALGKNSGIKKISS